MQNIRNFSIIAHIDHGKSTLADRFLELTGTIPKEKMKPQYLDMMDLERERGITIKMQPCRMEYQGFILNLIDTPGHVDFSYEVSRSLAAVEGAVLLVDATKGIQAQTLANLEQAQNPSVHTQQKLVIIPVVNKIDSPQARVEETKEEISKLLNIPKNKISEISAKLGTNIEQLLDVIIEKTPFPTGDSEKPFKALIFDSKYDSHKGVIAYVRVFDGKLNKDEKIYLIGQKIEGHVKEIGYFKPELKSVDELSAGEIGYIATGIKEPGKVRVGDTIIKMSNVKCQMLNMEALPGYREPKPMVFASIYPANPDDFDLLKEAVAKLKLNDASFTFEPEMKESLGRGFRCGFLGLLHAEIITERLKREFDLNIVLSTPSVIYKVINNDKKEILIYTSADWIDSSKVEAIQEPWVKIQILTPLNYLGQVSELLSSIDSKYIKTDYLGAEKVELIYEAPLREIITKNFYDKLKGISQGFASMNYEILDWRKACLVKLDVLILGKKEEALSRIIPEKEAQKEGKKIVEKLKETLPPQLFSVPLQAAVGGQIIARETIKAKRRDVIAPLYGGDYTRKRKLLEKQKKGKKELKEKGRIQIPPRVFLEMFRG